MLGMVPREGMGVPPHQSTDTHQGGSWDWRVVVK